MRISELMSHLIDAREQNGDINITVSMGPYYPSRIHTASVEDIYVLDTQQKVVVLR